MSLWRKGKRKRFRSVKLEVQVLSRTPICPDDETGKRAGLKIRILWVQVPLGTPNMLV